MELLERAGRLVLHVKIKCMLSFNVTFLKIICPED